MLDGFLAFKMGNEGSQRLQKNIFAALEQIDSLQKELVRGASVAKRLVNNY